MSKPKKLLTVMLCSAVVSGCSTRSLMPTGSVAESCPEPVRLSPPPADVMVKQEANFRQKLLSAFSTSPTTPTPSSSSSTPPKP